MITKYAYTIVDPDEIKYQLQKALHIAKSGRPGPVLIDIPDDLQRQLVDPLKLKNFQAPAAQELPHLKNSLQDTMDSIMNSKKMCTFSKLFKDIQYFMPRFFCQF
mgnify:CR=1 FL=1